MAATDDKLNQIKIIPVMDIAARLQIKIKGHKAFCFAGHDKKTPSLSFEPNRNIWTCFGCGKKGNGINLVMEVFSCDFKTALDWFRSEYGVGTTRSIGIGQKQIYGRAKPKRKPEFKQASLQKHKVQSEFSPDHELYTWLVEKCGAVESIQGQQYLNDHGISRDMAIRFNIRELRDPLRAIQSLIKVWGAERVFRSGIAWGSDEDQPTSLIWTSYALLFPFIENGNVHYLQGRLFAGKRKYVNLRGLPKLLFNQARLRLLTQNATVHICEGIPDAIALEGMDLPAVAVLGATSFRAEWVDDFVGFEIVLLPDGDAGGNAFTKTVGEYFEKRGKNVRIIKAPQGKDVAEVIAQMRDGKDRE